MIYSSLLNNDISYKSATPPELIELLMPGPKTTIFLSLHYLSSAQAILAFTARCQPLR
jgi:hypothetical protein